MTHNISIHDNSYHSIDHQDLNECIDDENRSDANNRTSIIPYERNAIPGVLNLFQLPVDIYVTIKAFIKSLQYGEGEELTDTITRLLGMPANIINTSGTIAGFGKAIGIIGNAPWYLAPITIIAGLVLCIIEGMIDIFSLQRQKLFKSNFHFSFLSQLRTVISDIDPQKTPNALKKIQQMIDNDLIKESSFLDKEKKKEISTFFQEINEEVENNQNNLKEILDNHRTKLQEIAIPFLTENLQKINDTYLLMNPSEITEIEKKIRNNHPNLQEKDFILCKEKKIEQSLNIKHKKLSRRVCPWMVREAMQTIDPILAGIANKESNAIDAGLGLIDDLHMQSKKKSLLHVLGIISLIFASASLIAMAILTSPYIPYLLAVVAMTFSLSRSAISIASLKSRGWTFEAKKIIPLSIRRRIFSNLPAIIPQIQHSYKKIPHPKIHEWITEQ